MTTHLISRRVVSADAPPHTVAHPMFITRPLAFWVAIQPLSGPAAVLTWANTQQQNDCT